jgi:hypothetical protein
MDRSTTYETAKPALWMPCATSRICTAMAAIATIAPKSATRKPRSSLSNRSA